MHIRLLHLVQRHLLTHVVQGDAPHPQGTRSTAENPAELEAQLLAMQLLAAQALAELHRTRCIAEHCGGAAPATTLLLAAFLLPGGRCIRKALRRRAEHAPHRLAAAERPARQEGLSRDDAIESVHVLDGADVPRECCPAPHIGEVRRRRAAAPRRGGRGGMSLPRRRHSNARFFFFFFHLVVAVAGEVIVIRYQHIAGCQSLYLYILKYGSLHVGDSR